MFLLLALALFFAYRYFRYKRRSRPGFMSSSSHSPSFFESFFGAKSDINSVYDPVNGGFDDDDDVFNSESNAFRSVGICDLC